MVGQLENAEMISPAVDGGTGTRASFVRKIFTIDSISGGEQLNVTALGLYRAIINGRRVGDDLLTPGWTVYSKRLSFQTYDVGELLKVGENIIDIWLADGWFRSPLGWAEGSVQNTWGNALGAMAEITNGAGAVLLTSGQDWSSGLLPILKSGIYFGEIYDARLEELEASHPVIVLDFDHNRLVPSEADAVHELAAIEVVGTSTDRSGSTVYDFGQNCAGFVRFSVEGERGSRVTVEHAEILDQSGDFYNGNFRTAEARLEYVLKGNGEETYSPFFTFQGFRYARVMVEGDVKLTSIALIPISSVGRTAGGFTCGNDYVNRLVSNTIWSMRSNFIEVPTDCPQRDERLGWTGDAQIFAPTACYLSDVHRFFKKWIRDVIADQREDGAIAHVTPNIYARGGMPNFYGSTGWGDAIVIIPWVLFQHYGDEEFLKECLPAMLRWNDFVWSISNGPIVRPPRTWDMRGFTFGDWLQPFGSDTRKPLSTIGDDAAATIYLYISSHLISRIAEIIDEKSVAERLAARAEAVREAYQEEFVTARGRTVNDDQTSYALAFFWDLIPESLREQAANNFKSSISRAGGRIGTGFIGTPVLLPALVKAGQPGLAASVFLQQEVPGWLAQVVRGATTIWERWDGIQADGSIFEPSMNSYNHYSYGAVCQWLFESVAGFRPDPGMPAFRSIIFEPTIIPELSPVSAHHDSASGRVEAAWRVEGDLVTYDVRVPDDSIGSLVLADGYIDVEIDGVRTGPSGLSRVATPLSAGHHTITFRLSPVQ